MKNCKKLLLALTVLFLVKPVSARRDSNEVPTHVVIGAVVVAVGGLVYYYGKKRYDSWQNQKVNDKPVAATAETQDESKPAHHDLEEIIAQQENPDQGSVSKEIDIKPAVQEKAKVSEGPKIVTFDKFAAKKLVVLADELNRTVTPERLSAAGKTVDRFAKLAKDSETTGF